MAVPETLCHPFAAAKIVVWPGTCSVRGRVARNCACSDATLRGCRRRGERTSDRCDRDEGSKCLHFRPPPQMTTFQSLSAISPRILLTLDSAMPRFDPAVWLGPARVVRQSSRVGPPCNFHPVPILVIGKSGRTSAPFWPHARQLNSGSILDNRRGRGASAPRSRPDSVHAGARGRTPG
jgi:hypothetical protein